MAKVRGFSIVLHDLHKGLQSKDDCLSKLQTLPYTEYVIAEELYNHQEGSHIHMFFTLRNPVYFTAALKLWCTWWKSGRVEVDKLKGTMTQACKYLMEDKGQKDKYYDPNPYIYLKSKNANEVGVEAQAIDRDDLAYYYCTKCTVVDNVHGCQHWKALYEKYRSGHPLRFPVFQLDMK